MANNGRNFFGGGRGWMGSGADPDLDRRPGSRDESREYGRRFDPRSERELSNRMETPNQIEQARLLRNLEEQAREAQDAARRAQKDVHFFPSVGKFIIPAEDTWAAHAELVKDESSSLSFNPEKYVYFDKIIAEKFGNKALYDPKHRDYAKYEGLRTNLEVLRNDIIGMYLDDGGFDPGDEAYIPYFASIASALGEALANDKWYKRPFTRSISVDVANVEGVGAREMYKYLLEIQENPGMATTFRHAVLGMLGAPDHAWGLLPLEKTPYSDANLAAPPPSHGCLPQALTDGMSAGEQMALLGAGVTGTAQALSSVETLQPPAREASVEEARTILRWLRNLQFTDQAVEEWVGHGTPAEQLAKAEALSRLVEIYNNELRLAGLRNPKIGDELAIQDANDAAGAIAMAITERGFASLPSGHPDLIRLEQMLDAMPEQWELRQTQPVERLLNTLEAAMEYASGKTVSELSPAQRLLNASGHMEHSAYQLRSIDMLEPPTREESIELAREILRRLKNLSFSDRTLQEIVDTGRPEDKAVLAQKLDEMVDNYKNLLFEAAQSNPNILNDPKVLEANQAAGTFTYALKLMAAKEIPSSVAAAQQIAADVTQMPEEWKSLHNRTVGRLVQSMEGGLEKAVGEIATQQEQQQQDEEKAQQVVDTALLHTDMAHRRRRRRRRSSTTHSAVTSKGASRRRNTHDINGDGVLDKFQGLDQQQNMRLTDSDLAAVRQLGGNLRSLSEQARTVSATVSDVQTGDKIAPDDKGFIERKTERDEQQRRNPRNNQPQI